jgi:hypothetical protein
MCRTMATLRLGNYLCHENLSLIRDSSSCPQSQKTGLCLLSAEALSRGVTAQR